MLLMDKISTNNCVKDIKLIKRMVPSYYDSLCTILFYFIKGGNMKKFESLKKGQIFDIEQDISKFWEDIDILNKSIELRNKKENFVFYDGPAYANGFPGVHHMLAKILKDAV